MLNFFARVQIRNLQDLGCLQFKEWARLAHPRKVRAWAMAHAEREDVCEAGGGA